MDPRLLDATHLGDHRIALRWDDGTQGEIDLADELDGTIFLPLRDVAVFGTFRLDTELGTLVWPNGADFAPEFLYELTAA
jgi:hypothetical protein